MDLNKQSKNNVSHHNKKQENLKGNEKRQSIDVIITCQILKDIVIKLLQQEIMNMLEAREKRNKVFEKKY